MIGMGPGKSLEYEDELDEPEPVKNTIANDYIPGRINNANMFTADYFQMKLVKPF